METKPDHEYTAREIEQMLVEGKTPKEIIAITGRSKGCVSQAKTRLKIKGLTVTASEISALNPPKPGPKPPKPGPKPPKLSKRAEVMKLVEEGKSATEITEITGIHPGDSLQDEAGEPSEFPDPTEPSDAGLNSTKLGPKPGPKLNTKLESAMKNPEFRENLSSMGLWDRVVEFLEKNHARNDILQHFFHETCEGAKHWRAIARTTLEILKEMGFY